MATITPGYDFTAAEVPTFNKMLQAALGLQIADLGLADLPADLIAMVTGTVSGSTGSSLPAEGWMWYTPAGELWVETRWLLPGIGAASGTSEQRIACPLFRPQGGYGSVRWRLAAITTEIGTNITTTTRHDNDERFHVWGETNTNGASDGGRCLGLNWETGTSGSRAVVILRGPATIRDLGFATEGQQDDARAIRNSSGAWQQLSFQQSNAGAGGRYGLATAIGRSYQRGTTAVTAMGGWWLHAGVVYGP